MGGIFFKQENGTEKQLLEVYKEKLDALDGAAVGFLTAIDVMNVTAELLEKELQMTLENTGNKPCKETTGIHNEEYRKLTDRLLTTFKYAVLHQKDFAVCSILSLIEFANTAIKENVKSIPVSFGELSLKKYTEERKTQNSDLYKDCMNDSTRRTEYLAYKIKILTDKINRLQRRESTFIDEEKEQRKRIKVLEQTGQSKLEKNQSRIEQLTQECNTLRRQLNEMNKKIEESQNTETKIKDMYEKESEDKKELQKLMKDAEDTNKTLRQKIKETETRAESSEKDLEQAILELKQKQTETEQLLGELKVDKNNLEKELTDLKQKNEMSKKENENEIQRLRNDLLEKENELKMLQKKLTKETSDKDKMEKDLSLSIKSSKNVQDELDKLSSIKSEYDDLQRKFEDTELENRNLMRKLNEAQEREKELNKKEDEIKELRLEISNMGSEKRKLKIDHASELKCISDKNEDLEKAIKEMHNDLKKIQQTVESEKKRHDIEVRKYNQLLNKTKEELRVALNVSKEDRERFENQKNSFENKLQTSDKELRDKRTEIRNMKKELQVERDSAEKFRDDCLSREVELKEKVRINEKKMLEIEMQKEQLSRNLKAVQEELDNMKRRKVIPVQLYCQKRSDLINNIEERLAALLQKSFISKRLELEFLKCSRLSEIQPQYPLLVVCITVSRIGTDVANALHGLPLSSNMAVTIFHHKDEHALPSQLSERVLTGKELRGIGGIFDMAYFSHKGIYPCEMNSNSADSLVTFIKRVARDIDVSK